MNNDLHATFTLVGHDLGLKKAYYPQQLADNIKYEMRMTSLTPEDIRTLYEIWIITVPAELLITGEDYSWDALIKL
jgi:hypothetical protein